MHFVTDHTVSFVQDLERVSSFDELFVFMQDTAASLGMRFFSFYEPQKTKGTEIRGIHLHNLPLEWLQRYLAMRYDPVSPVLRKIIHTRAAFLWSTLEPEGYLEHKRSRQMFGESGEFGLRDGFSYPILHCNGDMVVINLASDRLSDDPRLLPALKLVSLCLHEKFKALRGGDCEPPIPALSCQEGECLKWAAEGKTDWEIGEIVSISEASVRTYLKRARHKLGVTTKIQAVVAATRRGLIRA